MQWGQDKHSRSQLITQCAGTLLLQMLNTLSPGAQMGDGLSSVACNMCQCKSPNAYEAVCLFVYLFIFIVSYFEILYYIFLICSFFILV